MTHRATVRVRFEASEPTAVVELTVHHGGHDGLAPALEAVVEHVVRWHDCVRVVTFVAAADDDAQRAWEGAGLRAVAVDGDELVYHRAGPAPGLSPAGPS